MKEITLHKEMKIGLPNYSNVTVGMHVTWELENGVMDFDRAWDEINRQLQIQAEAGTDQTWIHNKEYKNHTSTVIKQKKS